jgi:hypothetical protein
MAKKRRKKASKKTSGSAKAKLGQVIKTLHSIKKSC